MPLASLAGWSGAVLGTITTIAQVVRVRREGTDGVNATTWALFLVMSGFWIAYGSSVGSAQVIVSATVSIPLLTWLVVLLDRREAVRGLLLAVAVVGVCAGLPADRLGWSAGVLGLGIVIVGTRMPQLLQLLRSRHADGVSVTSWLTGAASVVLWLAYYSTTGQVAAAVTMAAACCMNASIVVLTLRRHRTNAPELAPALAIA